MFGPRNKKGMYVATLTLLLVAFVFFSYGLLEAKQKIKVNVDNRGIASTSVIGGTLEAERLKFFVEETVKVAKDLALKNIKLNSGVYENCEYSEDYFILDDCDYLNFESSFYSYFNDSFDSILDKYESGWNSDDFEINFKGGILSVDGNKRIDLKTKTGKNIFYKELDHDNILNYVKKYSLVYEVPEDLIKAVIMQESSGEIGAYSGIAHGLMQINQKAHPGWFDGSRGCDVSAEVECNIRAGVELLRIYYDTPEENYESKIAFHCTDVSIHNKFLGYTGWKKALRLYNGPACGCSTCDDDYVEEVWEKYRGKGSGSVGHILAKIDYEEGVDYDFYEIRDVVWIGKKIRDCYAVEKDLNSCLIHETRDLRDYVYYPRIEGGLLKFDIEEIETKDIVIKFALNV